ncbi:MAG: hypothetical protein ACT4OZ_10085 [Gemmatimonadota bacterium]
MTFHRVLAALIAGVLLAAGPQAVAQSGDTTTSKPRRPAVQPMATPPCCSIVRIEARRSLVTARERSTGFTFRFAVRSRRLIDSLTIGQPVWADFAARTVKLSATQPQPCCAIIDIPPTPSTSSGLNDH